MDKAFDRLEQVVHYTSERHKVLASNIANGDTPGYKAKDIDFKKAFHEEMLNVMKTDKRHLELNSPAKAQKVPEPRELQPWEDKNDVELDVEVAKMTENSLLYETSVQFITNKFRTYKQAIQGR